MKNKNKMELTVKIKDKKMYNSFVQFFKSLGLTIVTHGEENKTHKKTVKFTALSLKTKGNTFTREEANER